MVRPALLRKPSGVSDSAALGQRMAARLAAVREHVRCENAHDLGAIVQTFGESAGYDDAAWDEHYAGLDEVRSYYEGLLRSVPDLLIDVRHEYVTPEHVILEVAIRGTHRGTWRGLPATGRTVAIPLCAVFTFDAQDCLTGERVYYDRATVLKQLGVFHEPETFAGRLATIVAHPLTIARIAAGGIVRSLARLISRRS